MYFGWNVHWWTCRLKGIKKIIKIREPICIRVSNCLIFYLNSFFEFWVSIFGLATKFTDFNRLKENFLTFWCHLAVFRYILVCVKAEKDNQSRRHSIKTKGRINKNVLLPANGRIGERIFNFSWLFEHCSGAGHWFEMRERQIISGITVYSKISKPFYLKSFEF